jgi:hypothetical protein
MSGDETRQLLHCEAETQSAEKAALIFIRLGEPASSRGRSAFCRPLSFAGL